MSQFSEHGTSSGDSDKNDIKTNRLLMEKVMKKQSIFKYEL